jgi:tRNA pseudouridine38-40 synthase
VVFTLNIPTTERYQAILAYDGTHFLGFQRQGKGRTVQGVVEAALRQLGWQERTILAAGRTDTGVHASGQVIAFDFEWHHPVEALQKALNTLLPQDVSACEVQPTRADFHPCYDAVSRRYRYSLY